MTATSFSGKHVAIVTSGLGAGGAERVIAQLAAHWVASGARVSILTFDRPSDPIFHPLDPAVEVHRLALHADRSSGVFQRLRLQLRRVAAVRRFCRTEKPDAVFAFLTKVSLLTLAAKLGTGVPVVACERNNPERQATHPLWNAILRRLYGRAALIVCQTRGSMRCIPSRLHDRVVVIPNPIMPYGVGGRLSGNTLVAVGRLTHQKGFDLLIAAFAAVAGRHSDWGVEIWGEGPERDALERQIGQLKLDDRIRLRGQSEKPGSWLETASAFILPSRYEGFPNVLGEAMAAGLPAIAARCDFGPEEIIEHGQTGLLAESENVDALSAAIDQLLSDADLRATLGTQGELAIRRFAPGTVAMQWDEALSRAVRQP